MVLVSPLFTVILDHVLLPRVWDKGHTPINVKLLQLLSSYPNTTVAAELSYGFSEGFRLMYTGPRRQVIVG
jgi:hypothetical protein